jgi:hypothetical protein
MARKGINKAISQQYQFFESRRLLSDKEYQLNRTCIFISHKKEDSEKAKEIAQYIMDCGVDIFFDENDPILSNPEVNKNPNTVTNAINNALKKSTHMICVISEKTKNSWWVPYEIGYVSNKTPFTSSSIGIVIIKPVAVIPEYLFLSTKIETTTELDKFVKTCSNTETLLLEKTKTFSELIYHPLNKILI